MKPTFVLPFLGGFLLWSAGCTTHTALRPSEFYSDAGSAPVGGPMRLAANEPVRRNPPRLPIVKEPPAPLDIGDDGLPLSSPKALSSTARPATTSPVPAEADTYFTDPKPEPSALGSLFDSVFVPPAPKASPAPSTVSTATYQTVK